MKSVSKKNNKRPSYEVNSPFRYPGGKFHARRLIVEHIPPHSTYIEPFCGGASIFFAKSKAQRNILNDKDEELVNCYIKIRDDPSGLADILEGYPADKETHKFFKNEYKPHNDLERAARLYFLNRTSFSGIMKMENCYFGYGDKYSMQPKNWRNHLLTTSRKLQGVEIYNKDFESIIDEAPEGSFLFIDPPYFNRDQDKLYNPAFTKEDHYRLSDSLRRNGCHLNFLLTYDNEEEIREMYSWSKEIMDKEWLYTVNRTDDQTKGNNGANKTSDRKRYKGKEIFIINYERLQDYEIIADSTKS